MITPFQGLSIFRNNRIIAEPGGGGDFDPSTYGTPILWLKADDISGADNDSVTSWVPDTYGTTASSGGAPPVLRTNFLNGHSVVEFVPSQFLDLASDVSSANICIFAVFMQEYFSDRIVILGSKPGTFAFFGSASLGASQFLWRDTDDGGLTSVGGDWSNWQVVSAIKSGTSAAFYQNGSLVTSGSISGTTAYGRIGGRSSFNFSTGKLAELLVYSTTVNSTNQAIIEAYLADKYAL